ncbi:MAG: PsbP-related protein [Planctomycetota bacterium]|jgi:hypothetical protein
MILATSASVAVSEEPTDNYKDATYGFSITRPEGWTTSHGTGGTHVMFSSPVKDSGDTFRENININVQPAAALPEADAYSKMLMKGVAQAVQDPKLIEAKKATVNGLDAIKVVYTCGAQQFSIKAVQYVVAHEGRGYVITCTALVDTFDAFAKAFETSVQTFQPAGQAEDTEETSDDDATTTPAEKEKADAPVEYKDKTHAFSLTLPKGWRVKDNVAGVHVMFVSPVKQGDTFNENINIVVGPGGELPEPEAYAKALVAGIGASFPDVKVVQAEATTINEMKALRTVYTYTLQKFSIKSVQYVIATDSKSFTVTCTALEETFDDFLEAFEAAVESFELSDDS